MKQEQSWKRKSQNTVVMMLGVGGPFSWLWGLILSLLLGCRCHIISQFNQGFYDCVIATDAEVLGSLVKGRRRGRGSRGTR